MHGSKTLALPHRSLMSWSHTSRKPPTRCSLRMRFALCWPRRAGAAQSSGCCAGSMWSFTNSLRPGWPPLTNVSLQSVHWSVQVFSLQPDFVFVAPNVRPLMEVLQLSPQACERIASVGHVELLLREPPDGQVRGHILELRRVQRSGLIGTSFAWLCICRRPCRIVTAGPPVILQIAITCTPGEGKRVASAAPGWLKVHPRQSNACMAQTDLAVLQLCCGPSSPGFEPADMSVHIIVVVVDSAPAPHKDWSLTLFGGPFSGS